MRFILLVSAVALSACASSVTPAAKPMEEHATYNEFCEGSGKAICSKAQECGMLTETYNYTVCMTDFIQGCCRDVDHHVCSDLVRQTHAEIKMCTDGLSAMSCDTLDKLLSSASEAYLPKSCKF